ncbi:branched-chain amino acid ABC transporter substrate-binding protein [Ralstonia pseudosolanacearum]|uniref:branched-chain amino acid ABC transporter substrate-binding protein n=1 Tax=Ralstonia pseudosolanacearum TaxID=1310165 RepID=UPI001C74D3F4|nr:branched-chain amino acid ABC transporter substrate-binding protein [Ralstonia sp. RS642]QWQ14439.1 branched-chain amino acid ABC transporter substrate-binding protein [Ralstonia solanacearum]UZF27942.1 branched-chain amino acid ABC transporter substrate-binding protein [Ralstonia sp. RS642]
MRFRCKQSMLQVVFIVAAAVPAVGWAQAEQTVRIGNAGPLTGGAAHWGKDNENGARLAVEDLNRKGLVIDGKKVRFELLSEDDQADPRQAMVVANKLVDSGVKAMLGHFNSGAAIPASAIYARAGIPDISVATNPQLTQQGFRNTFRIIASDDDVGAALSRFAVTTLNAKKVAIIDDRTAYGQGAAEVFEKGVKGLGASVVSQQFTSDKATDFMAILTSIKRTRPDVIFYGGMDAQGGLIARQMKQLGIGAKLLGTDGLCTGAVAKISAGAVNGTLYCTRGGKALDTMPNGSDFARRYKARFGTEVLNYAPYLYDSLMAIAAAMQAADSVEPPRYLPALAKISLDGTTGPVAFDEKGNLKTPGFTVFTYQDGKAVRVAGS